MAKASEALEFNIRYDSGFPKEKRLRKRRESADAEGAGQPNDARIGGDYCWRRSRGCDT